MKIKQAAQRLQSMGEGGDTILAHINPEEAAVLKAGGGSGKRNPKTGLLSYGGYEGGGTDFGDRGGEGGFGANMGDARDSAGRAFGNYNADVSIPFSDTQKVMSVLFGPLSSFVMDRYNHNQISGQPPVGSSLGNLFGGFFGGAPGREGGEGGYGDLQGGGSLPAPPAAGGLLGTPATPPAPIYSRPAFVPKFGRPRGLLSTGGQLRGFLGG